MSEETEPKVVSLRTRQAFEVEHPGEVQDSHIDTRSELLLETALGEVQAGRLKGVSLLAFISESNVPVTFVELPPGELPEAAVMRVVGAADLLKSHALDLAYPEEDYDDE